MEATYRHILLLTDGISEEGNSYALAREAKEHQVTISTIGLGADVHREYLEMVANIAEGKFYFLKDPTGLEQIVLRDVMEHTGTTAVEKPLAAQVAKQTEILDGLNIESAPPLKGYVRFEAKPSAETILRFDKREPLLVRWQYGLGRSAVFTSDAKTRWAAELGYLERLRQVLDQSEPRSAAAYAGGRGNGRVRQRQRRSGGELPAGRGRG